MSLPRLRIQGRSLKNYKIFARCKNYNEARTKKLNEYPTLQIYRIGENLSNFQYVIAKRLEMKNA